MESVIVFIVPRVLELTYTTHDLKPWAEALGYDGEPFAFDPDRRAQLRAELDAYYGRLYGLTRDDLRYILDPADVMGPDYPSETFRVLKNNDIKTYGEYRTQRLVLEAWDELEAAPSIQARTVSVAYPGTDADKVLCSVALQVVRRMGGVNATDLMHVLLFTTHPERVGVLLGLSATDMHAGRVAPARNAALNAQRLRSSLERRNAITVERDLTGQRVVPGGEIEDTLIWLRTNVGDWPDYAIKAAAAYAAMVGGRTKATAEQRAAIDDEVGDFAALADVWEVVNA